MSARAAAVTTGAVDGLATLLAAGLVVALFGPAPNQLVAVAPGVVYGFVVPLCSAVAWRGFAHSRRIQAGDLRWRQPIREGFLGGFLPLPISQAVFMTQDALAAGQGYPTIASPISEWVSYGLLVLGAAIVLGLVGAVGAAILSGVNRVLLPRLSS